jgi:hypothetical protein
MASLLVVTENILRHESEKPDLRQKMRRIEPYKIILSLTFAILIIIASNDAGLPFFTSDTEEDDRLIQLVCSLDKYNYSSDEKAVLEIRYYQGTGEVTFGFSYEFAKKVDGEWIEVPSLPPDSAWPASLCLLSEGGSFSQNVPLSRLDSGEYQLIKTVNLPGGNRSRVFRIEFSIIGAYSEETPVVIQGVLESAEFPVRRFGPSGPATGEYFDLDVLILNVPDANNESKLYYLHYGGRCEMMLVNWGGNGIAGELTFDEISDIYGQRVPVEVEGQPYELTREGQTYNVFHVERIEALDREMLPLVVYQTRYVSGKYTPEISHGDLERVTFPRSFHVGRDAIGKGWKDVKSTFNVILNPGETVRIQLNSSHPFFFGVYVPNSTLYDGLATRWGVLTFERRNASQVDIVMAVFERGNYVFLFDAEPTVWAEVSFDCQKTSQMTQEILFIEEGSHSSETSGMGSVSLHPIPLPNNFVIGRTWVKGGAWADHSYAFSAEFQEGDLISVEYNATQPIRFTYRDAGEVIESLTDLFHEAVYVVGSDGTQSFAFHVEKTKTAIVSFKCEKVITAPSTIQGTNDPPVVFQFIGELYDTERGARFPPRFNATWLRGKLNVAEFIVSHRELPTDEFETNPRDVLVIDSSEENETRFLHLGVEPEMIVYPDGGHVRRGNFNLFDMIRAYELGLLVEVEGFSFTMERYGAVYEMFHVTSIRIPEVESLPLHAEHSWGLKVIQTTKRYSDDELTYFPVSFRLGLDTYGDEFGSTEHFYHVLLYEGERIKFRFNATGPVEFGFYTEFQYSPSVLPFNLGDPDDYVIWESRIEAYQGLIEIDRTGYYTFAFRGWSGRKSVVTLSCERTG